VPGAVADGSVVTPLPVRLVTLLRFWLTRRSTWSSRSAGVLTRRWSAALAVIRYRREVPNAAAVLSTTTV
jgi:hypothetical protein